MIRGRAESAPMILALLVQFGIHNRKLLESRTC